MLNTHKLRVLIIPPLCLTLKSRVSGYSTLKSRPLNHKFQKKYIIFISRLDKLAKIRQESLHKADNMTAKQDCKNKSTTQIGMVFARSFMVHSPISIIGHLLYLFQTSEENGLQTEV